MRVMRYRELNPVSAAMVERPDDYRWSSVHTHLVVDHDSQLTLRSVYLALAANQTGRVNACRE